jgi:hypothetical protein
VYQKCLASFELWRWRRIEKVSWSDIVKNEKVLHRVKEERNIVHRTNERRLIGLVLFCVEPAFQNTLLKERQKDREDEEDVSCCCVTLR